MRTTTTVIVERTTCIHSVFASFGLGHGAVKGSAGGSPCWCSGGGAALQHGGAGGSAAAPGRAGMRDELAMSTAKGLIKVSNFPLFPFFTAA